MGAPGAVETEEQEIKPPVKMETAEGCSLLVAKENQKTTSDFDALDPRERGYSPLSDPEGVVETEKS